MKLSVIIILLLVSTSLIAQTDHKTAMDERGNHAMGFDQQKTTHHFLLAKDGGTIEVRANSAKDEASIEQIRMHLPHITHSFASGDFNDPMFVHDQTPPGVPVMKRLKKQIHYSYEAMDSGGRVVIKTTNSEALKAVWTFLRLQITEHKTGDPVTAP